MSTAYHPQTDGQTEVINRVVEQYLRAFVHDKPSTWGRFLMWMEWSYNTSVHSATGMSPYEITFGKKPPNLPQYVARNSNIDVVDTWLTDRDLMFKSLRHKLFKAQQHMKELADKHHRELHRRRHGSGKTPSKTPIHRRGRPIHETCKKILRPLPSHSKAQPSCLQA